MYYHASGFEGIKVLEPRVSNHGKPLIYFSDKKENVLVYLSNAIEKFCKENNFEHQGVYTKWGPYGFNKDGIIQLEEYYPDYLYETYKGVSGYIYKINNIPKIENLTDIPHAYSTSTSTKIDSYEYIPDAYEAIMEQVNKGNIILVKYDDFIRDKKDWLKKIIISEYEQNYEKAEYRFFLENKFKHILKDKIKNISLYVPELKDFWYEQKVQADPLSMSYNAGYDVSYYGYDYKTGCIDFPKERWKQVFNKRIKENRYFAYIKDENINEYVGYVNYHYNKNDNRYECGIVIEAKYRGKGYSKIALKLLCNIARINKVKELYDSFEIERKNTLKVFKSVGFKIVEEQSWKKFNKDVNGVLVKIKL